MPSFTWDLVYPHEDNPNAWCNEDTSDTNKYCGDKVDGLIRAHIRGENAAMCGPNEEVNITDLTYSYSASGVVNWQGTTTCVEKPFEPPDAEPQPGAKPTPTETFWDIVFGILFGN